MGCTASAITFGAYTICGSSIPGSCVQQISVTVLNGSAALDEGLKAGIVAERVEIGIVLEPCFVSKTKFHRVFETAQGFVGLAQ